MGSVHKAELVAHSRVVCALKLSLPRALPARRRVQATPLHQLIVASPALAPRFSTMADSRILEQPKAPALLKVVFAFSGAVPGQMREQLRPLLGASDRSSTASLTSTEGRGGTSAGLGDDNITHVISPTLDFAERAELETRKIAIVTVRPHPVEQS